MKNGKRSIALAMLLLLSLPMATILIESVHAAAVDYGFGWWDGASAPFIIVTSSAAMPGIRPPYHTNDTLVLKGYTWSDDNLLDVTFRVNNTQPQVPGANNIVRVQLHIWEDTSLGAIFHYIASTPQNEAWKTRILEKDTKGWARLLEFYLDQSDFDKFGIEYNTSQSFTVIFGALAPHKTLNYTGEVPEFILTAGFRDSFAEDQSIYWYLGAPPPTVTVGIIPSPINGNVTGLLYGTGCGHHYFNVTFAATDMFGLLNYTISIAGPTPATEWHNATNGWISYPKSYTNVTQWVDFLDGSYTVTVTVFNRIGMSASDSISFWYVHPQRPIGLSTTSGYAASDTWIVDAVSGMVNSTQTVYGNKVFGTTVTVSGYGFGASKTVKVTVYIPTYYSYNSTYGSFEVLVAKPTTDAYGNFTTWFIFPKAPMGTYNVTGVSPTYTCATTFQVLPQVIYNPNSVIGPAVVNVEATGFPMPSVVPGPNNWNKILILCNNKDTLLGIDSQVLEDWYIDANGTLQNVITGVLGGRRVHNGIVWPALQPGTYNLTLVLYTNDQVNQPLLYWNSPMWQSITTNYFEHTNIITVQETLSLLISIKNDTAYIRTGTDTINANLNTLMPKIDRIDGNVVTISTTVGSIKATLDQLSPVITRIDGNVVTINSTLGPMSTTLNAINAKITSIDWTGLATMATTVGQTNVTITRIDGNVASVKANTDTIPGISSNVTSIKANTDTIPDVKANADNIPGLTTPIYIAVVLSLIAAIAAIAGAFLIYRKTA